MNIPLTYYCDVCEERYSTKNAVDKCRQLPLEEIKFSLGDQVVVDAGKSTEQTGTVVGIKYIAGFSGGKHFASYTVELSDKSLVQRNTRSLKLYSHVPHPNKQEILDGIASGRDWEFRPVGKDEWISPLSYQISPAWAPDHDYRLTPEYVPLGPEDVPPGSVFRPKYWKGAASYITLASVRQMMVCLNCIDLDRTECDQAKGSAVSWAILREMWLINRSLPLTGKWDANAWEPCKKLKQ